jgi:hypothetical protein
MLDAKKSIRIDSVKYGKRHSLKQYIFKCSECPSEIKSTKAYLKNHSGKCVSCAQYGDPYRATYNELLRNCIRRKLDISITYENFLEFTKIDKCHYCYSKIKWYPHTKNDSVHIKGSRAYKLYRMNNNIGYTATNSVVCCFKCNRAKSNTYTYEEWYNMTSYFRSKYD